MARANFVKSAQKDIYRNGKQVSYVSQKGNDLKEELKDDVDASDLPDDTDEDGEPIEDYDEDEERRKLVTDEMLETKKQDLADEWITIGLCAGRSDVRICTQLNLICSLDLFVRRGLHKTVCYMLFFLCCGACILYLKMFIMKRDYVGEIALADRAVKKITELFHLQETKDWEIEARKEVLKAFDHIRKYYSQEDIK